MTLYIITGLVLIALPVAFNVLFFLLAKTFDYPDILRKPTDHILKQFAEGGSRLIMIWYGFAITALLAMPMALSIAIVFGPTSPQLASISAIIGVLSGLTQAMGLLRWPLLVPMLATQYTAEATTTSQKEVIRMIFNTFHQYIGVVVGEHIGFLLTAIWTILVGVMMLNSSLFGAWLSLFGILSAFGILAGLLESAGWKPVGMINAISYIVWSLWLIVSGIILVLV